MTKQAKSELKEMERDYLADLHNPFGSKADESDLHPGNIAFLMREVAKLRADIKALKAESLTNPKPLK